MSKSEVRSLIRAYALTAKAQAICARIDGMKAHNDSRREYGYSAYGEECFLQCEKELAAISEEMTRIEKDMGIERLTSDAPR